jgi:ATP-binding cassette subfamily B protein
MVRNPPILLLDEPTTGLDVENEQLVIEAIECLMQNKTTILISHRLTQVDRADRVLVIDGGRLVESGTPAALRAAGGLYARLCARAPSETTIAARRRPSPEPTRRA